jgi:competence protein ComEC
MKSAPSGLPRAPLVLPLAATCIGILLDRVAALGAAIYLTALVASWCLLIWVWKAGHQRTASLLLLGVVAITGAAWHHLQWRMYASNDVAFACRAARQPAMLQVVACHAPRHVPSPRPNPLQALQSGQRSRFEATTVGFRNGQHWEPASGKLLVIVDGTVTGIQAGDRLLISGLLSVTQPPVNPGDVDFYSAARAQRRLAMLRAESPQAMTRLQAGSPLSVRRGLDWLWQRGHVLLQRHVAPAQAPLAAALLLGAREELDRDTTDAFVHTNTIHLLAISGMHIAILAASLFFALKLGLLPRRLALVGVASATVLYTLVTDADPSAVRAMVVVLLAAMAMGMGRGAAAFNGWATGGLVVLLINPSDLFRAGPQLSFLAVAVMAWFWARWTRNQQSDPLDELVAATRPWPQRAARTILHWQGQMLLLSLAISLITMPIVGSQFHAVAPAAVLLSVVLSLPVSLALMSGFAVMLFGAICPPLGDVAGWLCGTSLEWIDRAVGWSAGAQGSFFWFAGLPLWWMAIWYLGLAALVLWPQRGWRKPAVASLLWALVGAACSLRQEPSRSLRCTFLSVGHGVSVVIELPEGQTVLYDAGRLGSPSVGARSIAGYLWSRRIGRLDAVVVSHSDLDHYNALPQLLKQFSVGRVYVSPQMFRDTIEPLAILQHAIEQSGAWLRSVAADDTIELSQNATLRVLHPPPAGLSGNDNAHSIVLALEYDGRRILLPGDLESTGMEHLLAQAPYDCDIALAPHHGSTSGSSHPAEFRAWSQPEWLVISGSVTDDERGDLADLYQSTGATVLHTAHDGAGQFEITRAGIKASHWRDDRWAVVGADSDSRSGAIRH